jgi:hypothetical protein
MSCPFNISADEANVFTKEQARTLILDSEKESWCFTHLMAYMAIRKEYALIDKELLTFIVSVRCGADALFDEDLEPEEDDL